MPKSSKRKFEIASPDKPLIKNVAKQGCSEGTSSVAFEVLLIKSEIDFINFIFNGLTSNSCFPKNIFFASRRERMFMDSCPKFWAYNSIGKMMTYYLRDTNKFLRYCTLCTNILKSKFPTKGIELTRLEVFWGYKGASFLRHLI